MFQQQQAMVFSLYADLTRQEIHGIFKQLIELEEEKKGYTSQVDKLSKNKPGPIKGLQENLAHMLQIRNMEAVYPKPGTASLPLQTIPLNIFKP